MPKGHKGQKRPADVIGCAVMVAKIATGEVEDKLPIVKRMGSIKGESAIAKKLTPAKKVIKHCK